MSSRSEAIFVEPGLIVHYTYILESLQTPGKGYVGHTSDLQSRLIAHHAGDCSHTRKHRPWKVEVFIAFETREQARRFEACLKTGSGRALANRHFWRTQASD